MSNKLNDIDTTLYRGILELVPNLNTFLIKNNILFEYILCLNDYNRSNRSKIPFNHFNISMEPNSVITWSFDWASENNMLINNGIDPVEWRAFHADFYTNYYLYNNITFNNIRMI